MFGTMRANLKIGLFQDTQDIKGHDFLHYTPLKEALVAKISKYSLANYLKLRVLHKLFFLLLLLSFYLFYFGGGGVALCIPLIPHLYLIILKKKKLFKLLFHW